MGKNLHSAADIISDFFARMDSYVRSLVESDEDIMQGLFEFVLEAWRIPKKFKGNSAQMGFIAEYIIFSLLKAYIENKYGFFFQPITRRKNIFGDIETNYFVDNEKAPKYLLCQGLQLVGSLRSAIDPLRGLPKTKYSHDTVYLVKEEEWVFHAVVEVKGYFDLYSLKGDLERLSYAEKNYPLSQKCAFVFIGFKRKERLSTKEIEEIISFRKDQNHLCILPGDISKVELSKFRDLFDFIDR